MFKVQVKNVSGVIENHYWINDAVDDFIQFLPNQFGVPKENFLAPLGNIYKFADNKRELELLLKAHVDNHLKLDLDGKIEVARTDPAQIAAGIIRQGDFDIAKTHREGDFSDLTPINVAVPALEQLDFGKVDAQGAVVLEAGYTIASSHELCNPYTQVFKTYTGTALSQWPYDVNGNFLGNN